MNKELLFQELSQKINSGEISREEILSRFGNVVGQSSNQIINTDDKHLSTTKILYLLGAAIVAIGIVIFISQIWSDIGSVGRIIVTLGLGLVFAGTGSVLLNTKPEDNIGAVFHAIGGLLVPGGTVVMLNELGVSFDTTWPVTLVFGAIFLFYLMLTLIQKHVVLTLFAFINGTVFIYLFVQSIIGNSFYLSGDIYAYLTMVIGISYVLFARAFENTWNSKLTDILYFFGTLFFLGATYSRVFDSVVWQLMYFFIVIGGVILSTQIKKRNILVVSTLFLIAHISFITGKYFADSLGWPISLILLGLIFIGLGYVTVNLNKKYIAK